MHPEMLNLVSIIQKYKLKVSTIVSENLAAEDAKGAFNLSFTHRKVGEFERLPNGEIPDARIPNGYIWKRIAGQVQRKSLEPKPWARLMNLSEFNKKNLKVAKSTTLGGLNLKVANDYEASVVGTSSIQNAKTHYFLKVSKIRETIYVSEGVCSIGYYKERHNTLYKAGYTGSLVRRDEQRLLTLE